MLVYNQAEIVRNLMEHCIGRPLNKDAVYIGIARSGLLIGGVSWYNFDDYSRSITVGIAAISPKWATRQTIGAILHYPFKQLGCHRVTALTAKGNQRSIKLLKGLGFRFEGENRKGWDGYKNSLTFGLLREDAKKWGIHG
jgi:RimJ/RimL family protein N-acetyltransferase